jgi:ElaB/YqjD/DUF883 family membrane-anchored ribosome-binding protein
MTQKKTSNPSSSAGTSTLKSDREKLLADLKLLMEDAKSFTETAGDESKEFLSDKAEDLREQLDATLESLKQQGEKAKEVVIEKTDEVEEVIRKNPWKAVGIAVAAGVLIDRLTRR